MSYLEKKTLFKARGKHEKMTFNVKYLNMREAGDYIGRSYRWMQRHYIDLIKDGVIVYRVPKDSTKGHLLFNRDSLDAYIESCALTADFEAI